MLIKNLLSATLFILVLVSLNKAQECNPPKIIANADSENIFSSEQETILGELIFQNSSGDFRLIYNDELTRYVDKIGQNLAKHLPDTGLKYKFYLIDFPDANAFNIPGGYVFLTRKLVAFSKNEDELAGVIAHELGHAAVRHGAISMSASLQKILGIEKLKDRDDIVEKYNLLIENSRTKRVKNKANHNSKEQLEADQIGLYAMVAAGYNPEAFSSFFSRLTETESKSRGWFSRAFGKTTPNEKRLKKMIKAIQSLPAECRTKRSGDTSNKFLEWQAQTVSYSLRSTVEKLPGLIRRKELYPKLRTDIKSLSVSKNGKYILAQDDYAITIASRDPLKVLFQIPAFAASRVAFTPDHEHIVFVTQDLRYEKWNIPTKKPIEVREIVVKNACWEYGLSPNGQYLACIDQGMRVQILDTKTGKKVWEKTRAFELYEIELIRWSFSLLVRGRQSSFFNIVFSPDSKYVVFSRSHRHRFRVSVDGFTAGKTEDKVLAINLTTLEKAKVSKNLKKYTTQPFAFTENDKIIAMNPKDYKKSGIFSFPDGNRISKFTFGGDEMKLTANPKYVIIKPIANAKMGVFDVEKGKIVTAINKQVGTMWGNQFIFEGVSGKVILRDVSYDENKKRFKSGSTKTLELPASSLDYLYAAEVSPNFKWLAFSADSRGGMWDLTSGERRMFLRGFRGAVIANDGGSVADFPKKDETAHSLVFLNGNTKKVSIMSELPERGAKQYGRFVLERKSLDEKSKSSRNKSLYTNVKFEIRDIITKKVVWSKKFMKAAPRYFFDDFSGRIIFLWRVGSKSGLEKLKEYPEMAARALRLKNDEDNFFVEIIDAFVGNKVIGKLLVETGNRSFDIHTGLSERNWLTLYDSEGRVLIYKIREGKLHQRFFGNHAVINPAGNEIIVENFPGEAVVYNLETGKIKANLVFSDSIAFMRFSLDGKALFVLTDSQTAYFFSVEKLLKNRSGVIP